MLMPKVGDILWDKAVGNAARRLKEPKITEVEVVKVGKKYFTCATRDQWKIQTIYEVTKDGWEEKTNYSPEHRLYPSKEAIQDEAEAIRLFDTLRCDVFGKYTCRLSLQALREIYAVVKRDLGQEWE